MRHTIFPILTALTLMGCGSGAMYGSSDLGVTPGGSQDIGVARDIIEAGGIPRHTHFSAEGLFSEHDLPLNGEECAELLCPRSATSGIVPIDDPTERYLVQLGFGTNIDGATFERRPLNLALAVDISGSMGTDKMNAGKRALDVLVGQLEHLGYRM